MEFVASKKVFEFFGLEGTKLLGYIVLGLTLTWIGMRAADIVIMTPYVFSTRYPNKAVIVGLSQSIMDLVILINQLVCVCVILAGITKKNRRHLWAYKPGVVCFILEIIIFAIGIWNLYNIPKRLPDVYIVILLTSEVLAQLITLFFLLMVRTCYLHMDDTNRHSTVENESTKLHDNMIIM